MTCEVLCTMMQNFLVIKMTLVSQCVFAFQQISSNGLVTFGSSYIWPEPVSAKKMLLVYASKIDITNTIGDNVTIVARK